MTPIQASHSRYPRYLRRLNTTANEVNNLDLVVIMKNGTAPIAATHDNAIEFDRNSRGWKIKVCN
jgi:hypothetical protein